MLFLIFCNGGNAAASAIRSSQCCAAQYRTVIEKKQKKATGKRQQTRENPVRTRQQKRRREKREKSRQGRPECTFCERSARSSHLQKTVTENAESGQKRGLSEDSSPSLNRPSCPSKADCTADGFQRLCVMPVQTSQTKGSMLGRPSCTAPAAREYASELLAICPLPL